jgi:hypothetical protein
MGWRQLNPEMDKPDPLEELLRPKTFDEVMEEEFDYVD